MSLHCLLPGNQRSRGSGLVERPEFLVVEGGEFPRAIIKIKLAKPFHEPRFLGRHRGEIIILHCGPDSGDC